MDNKGYFLAREKSSAGFDEHPAVTYIVCDATVYDPIDMEFDVEMAWDSFMRTGVEPVAMLSQGNAVVRKSFIVHQPH